MRSLFLGLLSLGSLFGRCWLLLFIGLLFVVSGCLTCLLFGSAFFRGTLGLLSSLSFLNGFVCLCLFFSFLGIELLLSLEYFETAVRAGLLDIDELVVSVEHLNCMLYLV